MPVANTVPNSDRYDDFNTTTASAGPFALTFAVWAGSLTEAEGDLEVRVDGVPTTAFSVTGTLDTTSVPHVILDAAVVLDVAVANAFVEVEGNGAARRIYQYPEGAGVPPRYQNSILNFCLATVRDLRQKVGRAIRVPYGEAPLELPAAADRAEGFLYFDSDGDPTSVTSGNVEALIGITDEIVIVAGIATEVQAVAAVDTEVVTVAGVAAEVVIVAGIAAQVVAVAAIDDEVEAVAAVDGEVVTVAGLAAHIPTLAALDTEIAALGAIPSAISTVAANIAAVLTVAAGIVAVGTVAGIAANVTTVAGISANVTSVAGNATNINAVAANATNINTVAGAAANINTVAGAIANVNTVATNIADVNTVAANIATISAKLAKDGSEAMSGALTIAELATPSTPASGFGRIYFKSDGKLYTLDDAGTETEVGSGGGDVLLDDRNIYEGYTPVYDLGSTGFHYTAGGGTNVAAYNVINCGTHVIPSGVDKQLIAIAIGATVSNGDAFETKGFRGLNINIDADNCDAYLGIGSITQSGGAKGVKGWYGRVALNSTDAIGAGEAGGAALVGGVTVGVGATANFGWVVQLTIDGDGDLSPKSAERFIAMGTATTGGRDVGYGIVADDNVGFATAFIRAWNAGAGPFLWWQEPDSGSGHITKFQVAKTGQVLGWVGAVGTPEYSFVDDPDTGMYCPTAGELAFAINGTLRLRFESTGNSWQVGSALLPATDNNRSCGSASVRWSNVYGTNIRWGGGTTFITSGSGTPEGVITAPVGALFTRTDGSTSTTLYVKTSGAGNTGWTAK